MSAVLTPLHRCGALPDRVGAAPARSTIGPHSSLRGRSAVLSREGEEGLALDPADAQTGGRLTLEQRLDSVWEGLHAGGAPECAVCEAALGPAGRGGVVRCGGCGSVLS